MMQISGGTAYETFVGEKCVYFFQPDGLHLIPCLFHVWTPGGRMSDTPETMGGLSGSTNCAPS